MFITDINLPGAQLIIFSLSANMRHSFDWSNWHSKRKVAFFFRYIYCNSPQRFNYSLKMFYTNQYEQPISNEVTLRFSETEK